MIDAQTLYLAGLISQATFALTLSLLAWSDRRTKGTVWLAGACALQFAWTASRTIVHVRMDRASETLSACLLVDLVYFVFVGFRWFVEQRGVESRKELLLLAGSLVLVVVASLLGTSAAVLAGRSIALGIGLRTVAMLWSKRVKVPRATARVCGMILGMTMLIIVVNILTRMPMEVAISNGHESMFIAVMREMTVTFITLLSFSFVAIFVGESNRRLQEDTRTDSLTTLRNRRSMEEMAVREVRRATERQTPLALLMLDLDHFKNLNDTWGHALGDRALRAVGTVLQMVVGSQDLTARMGGEEFAVLLPDCDIDAAAVVAERLREKIADLKLHDTAHSATVTVSIGVSALHSGEHSWTDMLCRADDALYRAKREGRNCVETCTIRDNAFRHEPGVRAWRGRWSLPKRML